MMWPKRNWMDGWVDGWIRDVVFPWICFNLPVMKVFHNFIEIHKLTVRIKFQMLQGLSRAAQI